MKLQINPGKNDLQYCTFSNTFPYQIQVAGRVAMTDTVLILPENGLLKTMVN
jgi:hypothetical protein